MGSGISRSEWGPREYEAERVRKRGRKIQAEWMGAEAAIRACTIELGNKDLQQIDAKAAEQCARQSIQSIPVARTWASTPVDKHADIDDLAVPDERRPSLRAPILKLFGYLIRALLRKWAKRLEKAKS